MSTFVIDKNNSDEQYLYVDVDGKGTVVIKREEEGIVVDIYPFHVSDNPVASTWVHDNDLVPETEQEEAQPSEDKTTDMSTLDAIAIIYDLATQNVLDEGEAITHDLKDEAKKQDTARGIINQMIIDMREIHTCADSHDKEKLVGYFVDTYL